MERKFWWLDTSDLALARAKLEAVRTKQLSEWNWISWDEADFPSPEEAELSLLREIGIPSMFSDGKVVCCQGLPSFHQKIAKGLEDIPDGILLVIMAPVLKTTSLYLKSKKDDKVFKIDESDDISKIDARAAFIAKRAEKIGVKMDMECCRGLAELCGPRHDMLTNELKKLRAYSEDGVVSRSDVIAVCSGEGEAVMFELTSLIMAGKSQQAHEWARRLLASSNPHGIVGFLCGWARTLCVVSACKCDLERCKVSVAGIYKMEKIGKSKARRVEMYPNTGRFYHTARELSESGRPDCWPFLVMAECHRLELATRLMPHKEDLSKEIHRFLERIMAEEEPRTLRPVPLPTFRPEREDMRVSKKYEVVDESAKDD